jgi:hypothetical protein
MNNPPPGAMSLEEAQAIHNRLPPSVADAFIAYQAAVRASLDAMYKGDEKTRDKCSDDERNAYVTLRASIHAEYRRDHK